MLRLEFRVGSCPRISLANCQLYILHCQCRRPCTDMLDKLYMQLAVVGKLFKYEINSRWKIFVHGSADIHYTLNRLVLRIIGSLELHVLYLIFAAILTNSCMWMLSFWCIAEKLFSMIVQSTNNAIQQSQQCW